jgi:ABC-type lipoprotein release transport system permease subunit
MDIVVRILVGVPAAPAVTRFMTSTPYRVKPWDPVTFATVVGVALVSALVACYVSARRATRVDPAVALRAE